ncbi:MAG TPA: GspH/FimT family pseudopilin [Allosphingosinicella sp.]|nr:GspH/FimT family pseudopilin [Allosphingosinicella sp.]
MAEPKKRKEGFESSWRSAQQGFESSWRSAQQGFTLIELMVVLVILGLAATAVVLTMPEPGGSLAGEADRFAARAKAARDTAILESRAVAVQVGRGGYEVARRLEGAWRTEARYEWAERTAPDLAGGAPASIRFDSTGSAEPARVVLRRGDDQAVIDVTGDGNVHVRR